MAAPAVADSLVATRTIRAFDRIGPDDVAPGAHRIEGAIIARSDAVGQEARVTIYAGRPVMIGDVGPAALIDRNQIVTLRYRLGGLSIVAEGRALSRGAVGERVRVLNLASKSTVTGRVLDDASVLVGADHGE